MSNQADKSGCEDDIQYTEYALLIDPVYNNKDNINLYLRHRVFLGGKIITDQRLFLESRNALSLITLFGLEDLLENEHIHMDDLCKELMAKLEHMELKVEFSYYILFWKVRVIVKAKGVRIDLSSRFVSCLNPFFR